MCHHEKVCRKGLTARDVLHRVAAIHRDRCTARVASLTNASVVNSATGDNVTGGNLWVPYARWVAGVGGEAPTATTSIYETSTQQAATEGLMQEQELIVIAANPDPSQSIIVKPRLSEEFLNSIFGTVSTRPSTLAKVHPVILYVPSLTLLCA
eukprot:COSAG02_NODE_205_length_29157_cov_13.424771_11_plen_153_part_00